MDDPTLIDSATRKTLEAVTHELLDSEMTRSAAAPAP